MNPWDEKAADVAELVALEASEWSPAVATRFGGFMAGARWQREALLSDETEERVADVLVALDGDDYLMVARAALAAALGIEGDE